VSAVNRAADAAADTLRISMDAKAAVKIGPFSRRGRSRVPVAAADHDFQPAGTVTPVGILLPATDELFLYAVTSRVTSDCLADRLAQWWAGVRERFAHITTLVLNLDNGPESHRHRTQFVARLVQFAADAGLTVRLAYYPPYHSKYNPIERVWGFLEQHWNGSLLDSVETILHFARTFSFRQVKPAVHFISKPYYAGAKLTQKEMRRLELRFQRLNGLRKWFVLISPVPLALPA
jgi:transposase